MDYSGLLSLSYYKTISAINEPHNIYLVKHQDTGKIFVKKVLDVYNIDVYRYLKNNPITGVPKIIDIAESDGRLTIIEEFVTGPTLEDLISEGALTKDKIIRYIINLCEITEHLHSLKPPIIHRDIKPSNVIITSYDKVMLLDFNAAKYFNKNAASDTVKLGTEGYAAPEQYGFGSSTPQTDIYSIGILIRELSSSLVTRDKSFEPVIQCCTQLNPKDRFKSVGELKEAVLSLNKNNSYSYTEKGYSLMPPGFRTKTPWKMLVSSAAYLLIFWLCLTVEIVNTTGVTLWIERIFSLCMFLSVIAGTFNYCNIQNINPMCRSKNLIIRYMGILILDAAMVFSLMFILVLILVTFFNA